MTQYIICAWSGPTYIAGITCLKVALWCRVVNSFFTVLSTKRRLDPGARLSSSNKSSRDEEYHKTKKSHVEDRNSKNSDGFVVILTSLSSILLSPK